MVFMLFRMVRDKLFKGDFSYNMKLLQVNVLFYILNKFSRRRKVEYACKGRRPQVIQSN